MDSLQAGLALAGGAILLGIIAYNAWVVRRNTPRQAERLEPEGPPESGEAADPALVAWELDHFALHHVGETVDPADAVGDQDSVDRKSVV